MVARGIHFLACSDESPFIAVSCPTLPESIVESELFGHAKGAFTGADADKPGYFELADGGTLFLDEIADLSNSLQPKLLRSLETRAIRRVGGTKEISLKLQLIAATNNPLEVLMEERQFRRDLFYRLNVYSIHLLPLRERRDDILPLAEHFLSTYGKLRNLNFEGFSLEAKNRLLAYDYPGNVRELRNMVERSAILGRSCVILPDHLNLPRGSKFLQSDKEKERIRILEALEGANWNRRQTAENLDMAYSTLRYRMKKFGIG